MTLPRSVYIHVPFCRHRCGYCNFSLVAGRDHLIDRYLGALEIELRQKLQPMTNQDRLGLDTLFLGGGTPSHLGVAQLEQLFDLLAQWCHWDSSTEVSVECNPNDVDAEKMAAMSEHGVNRISLGAQSLRLQKLESLERDHSEADVANAVQSAKQHGCGVSLDLIFASPDESLEQWQEDLRQAMLLAPDHLSTYELTFEKGTQFWNRLQRNQLSEAHEELRAEMYEYAIGELTRSGFEHYEVSSFAKAGHRCRHNQVYWSGLPYLAFGPGASQFVNGIRETNHRSPTQYFKRVESGNSAVAEREQLSGMDAARERLVVGLRRLEGVDVGQLEASTGFQLKQILDEVHALLIDHGLIELVTNSTGQAICRLTRKGLLVSDGVAGIILRG